MLTTYDKTSPESIEEFAKQLIGHSFEEVLSWEISDIQANTHSGYDDKQRKGGLGNLLEEQYFGYKANSDALPDFPEAGVELKVTPYEKKKNGAIRAGERLVLSMIDYTNPIEPDLYKSHLWSKCEKILLVYYWRNKLLQSNLEYMIDYVSLFTPPEEDMRIILDDYRLITEKIAAGKADELSEADTMYLGACTKGSTKEKSTVPQAYYNPDVKAMKRAFCFKNSYMTYVLNNYLIPSKQQDESIIKDVNALKNESFEDYIIRAIDKYVGMTDEELCKLFDRPYNKNKSQWVDLAFRMLGIKSNSAKEFKKAQINVKAVRLEEKGSMTEHSSLPNIIFKELVQQEWEESDLYNYFSENKFLFVVYRKQGNHYILKGAQLWNMPYHDLETDVREGWEKVKETVLSGVEFTLVKQKNGIIVKNNLLKQKENRIIHVRPHTSKTYAQLKDGTVIAKGTIANSDELPDGQRISKQSFWLNNTYVVSQLENRLKQ